MGVRRLARVLAMIATLAAVSPAVVAAPQDVPASAPSAIEGARPAPVAASSPVASAPAAQETLAPPPPARPRALMRTVIGLLGLLALAYVAAHPAVRRLEERLGIAQLVTAGFPFVAIGVALRHSSVGVLTDPVLDEIGPLLQLGLGWIGFLVGFQFDVRQLDRLPHGTATLVMLGTVAPFLTILGACGAAFLAFGVPWSDASFLRQAATLATAGALAAPIAARRLARGRSSDDPFEEAGANGAASSLDEIAGVVGLAFLGAFTRPEGRDVAWSLPATGWLFVTIGMGAALGILIHVIMRRPATPPESVALLLGSVAFAAGMARTLWFSPVVVCFAAGVVIANLPGPNRRAFHETLLRLERPIYLLFLTVVGALWSYDDWRGWVLVPVFVASRFAGRLMGVSIARRQLDPAFVGSQDAGHALAPMGALSIAIVVSSARLERGATIPWIVTAVIGGAMLTELIVQFDARRARRREPAPA